MAQLKFYRGLKANYVAETTHKDGIYFATDTNEILMNGKAYTGALAAGKVVTNVALSSDKSKLVITYSDTTTTEIEVGSGKYTSAIEDKDLAMPNAVGGIAKGTKVSALEGQTYDYMWDELLFPTINPTFTAPTASISFKSYSTPQEVGATAPTAANFNTSLNKGAITLNGTKQADRSGNLDADNSFIFVNGQESNTTLPTTVTLVILLILIRQLICKDLNLKITKETIIALHLQLVRLTLQLSHLMVHILGMHLQVQLLLVRLWLNKLLLLGILLLEL